MSSSQIFNTNHNDGGNFPSLATTKNPTQRYGAEMIYGRNFIMKDFTTVVGMIEGDSSVRAWLKEFDLSIGGGKDLPPGHLKLYQNLDDGTYIPVPGITLLLIDVNSLGMNINTIDKSVADRFKLKISILPREPGGATELITDLGSVDRVIPERTGWSASLILNNGRRFDLSTTSYDRLVRYLKLLNLDSKIFRLKDMNK